MTRTATLLALAVPFATAVVAAPVPKPSEKELIARQWGKTGGPGEFELKGKQLTLRSTLGKPNRDFRWADRMEMPHTEIAVRGDFELTVRVLEAAPPNKDAKCDSGSPEAGAGLYVRGGESSVRYLLNQSYQRFAGAAPNDNLQRWLRFEASYPRGGAGSSMSIKDEGKSTYLRITRKDNEITTSYSFDGEKWTARNNPFRNIDMSIPDEVTVGVFYSHSTYQFGHATFDNFTIGKPKDEKKAEKPKGERPK